MHQSNWIVLSAINAAMLLLEASTALGQSVYVANPSFEMDSIQGPNAPVFEVRPTAPTGWTYLAGQTTNGLFHAAAPGFYGGEKPGFDGSKGAFIYDGAGATQQTLMATLQPNTTYTLSAGVGSRANGGDSGWGGYRFTLSTTSGHVVGDWVGVGRNITMPGATATTSRTFTTGANPLGVGEHLQITVSQPYIASGNRYTDFDNIRLSATPMATRPANTPVDVVIVSGQSNAHGWGSNAADLSPANRHYADSPNPKAMLAYKEKNLPDPAYSTGSFGIIAPQGAGFGGNFNGFGPELSLGTDLANKTGRYVAVIKYAVGSASLYGDFNASANSLYPELISTIGGSLKQLRDQGLAPNLAGMFWLQGESDTNESTVAANYGLNLAEFVQDLRQDLDAATLKFFATEINGNTPVLAGRSEVGVVNAGMMELANTDPNVYFIPTMDITDGFADGIHYSADQNILIGQRWASAYLASAPEPGTWMMLLTAGAGSLAYALRMKRVSSSGRTV